MAVLIKNWNCLNAEIQELNVAVFYVSCTHSSTRKTQTIVFLLNPILYIKRIHAGTKIGLPQSYQSEAYGLADCDWTIWYTLQGLKCLIVVIVVVIPATLYSKRENVFCDASCSNVLGFYTCNKT